jgi:hypothetical protein
MASLCVLHGIVGKWQGQFSGHVEHKRNLCLENIKTFNFILQSSVALLHHFA